MAKVIDEGFDEWCRRYEAANPGFFYRKFRPSPNWPILFQVSENGGYRTIAQTPAPEPSPTPRVYWRT